MLLFDRRNFLVSAVALAGCGFTPSYKEGGKAHALRGRVAVDAGRGRDSFTLSNRLTDIFAHPENPRYSLSFTISTAVNRVGITQEQEITRFHVKGTSKFSLSAISTGQVVTSGTVSSFTAYSTTGTTVATRTANRDAYERLATILADKIAAQVQTKVAAAE